MIDTFRHYPGGSSIKYLKISYLRKERQVNITERRRIATKWHWMVTEWSLKCTCRIVMERWLNGAFYFSRNGDISSWVFAYQQTHHRTNKNHHWQRKAALKALNTIATYVLYVDTRHKNYTYFNPPLPMESWHFLVILTIYSVCRIYAQE